MPIDRSLPDSLKLFEGRFSEKFFQKRQAVVEFINEEIIPAEPIYAQQQKELPTWGPDPAILDELRAKAKQRGLWNMFLPDGDLKYSLTNFEYAPICEILGKHPIAQSAMNCAAPDTGNMEVLLRYGTDAQKKQWLEPLLDARIRSAFAMTEPAVASSDATNIATSIRRDGNEYVVNGTKWYISGACSPHCKVYILLGKSDPNAPRHRQHSMLIVPADAPGVKVVRPMHVFGYHHANHGHAEIKFENVRVPLSNILKGEGYGFEIAQGRLGPGRIHHAMRTIGVAERALAMMRDRVNARTAFGKTLAQYGTIQRDIALSRIDIERNRLLCMLAADQMDRVGHKAARAYIAMIKVSGPQMALGVLDKAIQAHGATGVGQDFPLSSAE